MGPSYFPAGPRFPVFEVTQDTHGEGGPGVRAVVGANGESDKRHAETVLAKALGALPVSGAEGARSLPRSKAP